MSETSLILLKDYFSPRKNVLKLSLDLASHILSGTCTMKFSPTVPLESLLALQCDFAIRINAKQLNIISVRQPTDSLLFSYPSLAEQAYSNGKLFQPIRDLTSLNAIQRLTYEMEADGMLLVTLPFPVWKTMLETLKNNSLEITIEYSLTESLCGLKFEKYFDYPGAVLKEYAFTESLYGYTKYWTPCIEDLKTLVHWTIEITTKSDLLPIATGRLQKIVEKKDGTRTYTYKSLSPLNASRVGFCVGNIRCANSQDHPLAYYFAVSKKALDCIEAYLVPGKIVKEIIEMLENFIGTKFQSEIKLVFLPNMGEQLVNCQKLVAKHAGLIILDERFLLNHNVIEYRYKIYEALAEAIAFKYFGETICEDSYSDYWLFHGLRTSLAKQYKIKRCGAKIHRYQLMRQMAKYIKYAKCGLDSLPLYSASYSHPAELQINRAINLKAQLVFHMIESMIGVYTLQKIYAKILEDANASNSPFFSTKMFMSIVKPINNSQIVQIVVRCLLLDCKFVYDKRNNSIKFYVKQESIARPLYYREENLIDGGNTDYKTSPFYSSCMPLKIDARRRALRWAKGDLTIKSYETNGLDIKDEQYTVGLKLRTYVASEIPLKTRFKKPLNKKKEGVSEMEESHASSTTLAKGGADRIMYENRLLETPIVWLRIDPDLEFIRKVQITLPENNWIFQLTKDNDLIAQIEAIKNLSKTGTETAYEEIRKVIEDPKYFFKVKKYAIKYISKMAITHTAQSISAERYLLDTIKKYRYDSRLNCYKSNNFEDLPEYYLIKHCIKYSSRPRESYRGKEKEEVILVDYSKICDALLKLLKENDNSHNKLDDAFYLKTTYESLGRAATFAQLAACLGEFKKCLKIEKISPSYSHSRAIGAVKGLGYLHISKTPYLENAIQREFAGKVKELEQLLQVMENGVQNKAVVQSIYAMEIKRIFLEGSHSDSLKNSLSKVADLLATGKSCYAMLYLNEVLSRVHKICKKFLKQDRKFAVDESCIETIWSLVCHPFGNISMTYLYSLKQIYWLLFQEKVPENYKEKYISMCPEVPDEEWKRVVTEDFDFADDLDKEAKRAAAEMPKEKVVGAESPREIMNE